MSVVWKTKVDASPDKFAIDHKSERTTDTTSVVEEPNGWIQSLDGDGNVLECCAVERQTVADAEGDDGLDCSIHHTFLRDSRFRPWKRRDSS